MKVKLFVLVLFAAGLLVGAAIADNGKGKGKGKDAVTATTTTGSSTTTSDSTTTGTTTTGKGSHSKVTLCHLTGSKTNPYVKISVAASAVKAKEAKGDVAPDASGKCPTAPPATGKRKGKGGGETTTGATTTAATTTAPITTTTHA